ncbi:aggregation-promoting factor C-terminal-like domain-containing protein [Nocardia xishanensis]
MLRYAYSAAAVCCAATIALAPAAAAAPPPDDPNDARGTESVNPALSAGVDLFLASARIGVKALALTIVPLHYFPSFDAIITRESGWNMFAVNPSSGAYGLGQALPPEKMSTHGSDWRFNPVTQLRWTYDYMVDRYGSPDAAWVFWQQNHWY